MQLDLLTPIPTKVLPIATTKTAPMHGGTTDKLWPWHLQLMHEFSTSLPPTATHPIGAVLGWSCSLSRILLNSSMQCMVLSLSLICEYSASVSSWWRAVKSFATRMPPLSLRCSCSYVFLAGSPISPTCMSGEHVSFEPWWYNGNYIIILYVPNALFM